MGLMPTASASSLIVIFGLRSRVWSILSFVLFMEGSISATKNFVNILDKYHKNPPMVIRLFNHLSVRKMPDNIVPFSSWVDKSIEFLASFIAGSVEGLMTFPFHEP